MIIKPFIKKTVLAVGLLAALPYFANAQTDPDLRDMERRMLEMQRQMMQQFRLGFSDGGFGQMGDSSSFFFKFDTTFGGDGAHFFRFPPTDLDSLPGGGEPGFEQFFQQFFGLGNDFGLDPKQPEGSEFLDENGSEELLPEERLRLKEQGTEPAEPAPAPKPKPKKRTTTRI
jgi:hypothetical protein